MFKKPSRFTWVLLGHQVRHSCLGARMLYGKLYQEIKCEHSLAAI